jgi:ATP-dependent protease Clp ATPase subunit
MNRKIIAGPSACICSECIALCNEILSAANEGREASPSAKNSRPNGDQRSELISLRQCWGGR